MEKGKLGIRLSTYAIIAFVLAIFGQMLLCALVLGFVLVVEKDEWTSRQCMQAFFLTFASSICFAIIGAGSAGGTFAGLFSGDYYYYGAGAGFSLFCWIVGGLLAIVVLIFEIIGLVNVAKGKEANVPLLSVWANKAFGRVQPKVVPTNYAQGYPPQGYPQGQQPVPPSPAAQQAWQQQAQQQAWAPPPVAPVAPQQAWQPPAAPPEAPPPPPPAYPSEPPAPPAYTNEPPAPPAYTNEPPAGPGEGQ